MIRFPNCKINLGLRVTARRPDGFHNIETVFHPVPLCDILEIVPSSDRQMHFTATGLPIPGDPEKNLVVKAFRMLQEEFGISGADIYLHKVIPMGSGLGGGSSDGAFTLSMLNDLFVLGLSQDQLILRAARLGSDCPFFLLNRPVYATGKGEVFGSAAPSLAGKWLALAIPGVHVSTAEAYAMITPARPAEPLSAIVSLPVKEWRGRLVHDF
ncbi:MAG TPA: 4-(cytidine 5'-diphospho)-2-C-methyl-D-erythritol kinase, partial [Bacteroidales bacterium]|nr:4-(cytidine 5'-diphospho)-2-C-methyl-D-erythritol kinase [Bacteroidales bacterium]